MHYLQIASRYELIQKAIHHIMPNLSIFWSSCGLARVQKIKCSPIIWQTQYIHQRIDGKIDEKYSKRYPTQHPSTLTVSEQVLQHVVVVIYRWRHDANDGDTRYENNSSKKLLFFFKILACCCRSGIFFWAKLLDCFFKLYNVNPYIMVESRIGATSRKWVMYPFVSCCREKTKILIGSKQQISQIQANHTVEWNWGYRIKRYEDASSLDEHFCCEPTGRNAAFGWGDETDEEVWDSQVCNKIRFRVLEAF